MLALLPLAVQLVPSLARWLFGPQAEATASDVAQAVQAVTGSTDPAEVRDRLKADPQLQGQLAVQLAQIAAQRDNAEAEARHAELIARLADVAGARTQTITLAQAHSPIAWSAPIISVIVLLSFGLAAAAVLSRAVPSGSETLAQLLLGGLLSMATSVVQYWVGSSAGSARKADDLRAAQDQLANAVPLSPRR
jgi:hypothetical protein